MNKNVKLIFTNKDKILIIKHSEKFDLYDLSLAEKDISKNIKEKLNNLDNDIIKLYNNKNNVYYLIKEYKSEWLEKYQYNDFSWINIIEVKKVLDKNWPKKLENKVKMRYVIETLKEKYPNAKTSLEFESPVQLMVAVQLSAQCTDKRVNIVTKELFEKYKTIDDFADADINDLERMIYSTGFYRNKAKNIKNCCRKLRTEYNYKFPDNMNEILKLDGVGRKTANLFLGEVHGVEGIVVDTHVKRISNRLGFIKSKNAEIVERELYKITPKEYWIELSHLFIAFGRTICISRSPKCEKCSFGNICEYKKMKLDK